METTTDTPASSRILFSLYLASGKKTDFRSLNLTQAQAQEKLKELNAANGYQPKTARPEVARVKIVAPRIPASKPSSQIESARAYIVANIDKLVHSFLEEANIVGTVKNDTNFVPDDGKRFVMFGGGCGFAWIEGFRKTAKNKALHDLIGSLKNEADSLVTQKLPANVVQVLTKHGSLRPLMCQSEHYNHAWRSVMIGWLETQGVKGCYVMSRLD